jgi:hypothetical protein
MSLDNTSQPSVKYCADKVNARYIHGRPESELVPSRYALRVGELDVMVVSDGVLSLLRELAANRESLVATHLSFPSVCHVAVAGDVFRWVPGPWEY